MISPVSHKTIATKRVLQGRGFKHCCAQLKVRYGASYCSGLRGAITDYTGMNSVCYTAVLCIIALKCILPHPRAVLHSYIPGMIYTHSCHILVLSLFPPESSTSPRPYCCTPGATTNLHSRRILHVIRFVLLLVCRVTYYWCCISRMWSTAVPISTAI